VPNVAMVSNRRNVEPWTRSSSDDRKLDLVRLFGQSPVVERPGEFL
jgi:hypothetical protein